MNIKHILFATLCMVYSNTHAAAATLTKRTLFSQVSKSEYIQKILELNRLLTLLSDYQTVKTYSRFETTQEINLVVANGLMHALWKLWELDQPAYCSWRDQLPEKTQRAITPEYLDWYTQTFQQRANRKHLNTLREQLLDCTFEHNSRS